MVPVSAAEAAYQELRRLQMQQPSLWRRISHRLRGTSLYDVTDDQVDDAVGILLEASIDWLDARHVGPQLIAPFTGLADACDTVASWIQRGMFGLKERYYARQAERRGYVLPYALPQLTPEEVQAFWRRADQMKDLMNPDEVAVMAGHSMRVYSWHSVHTTAEHEHLAAVVAAYEGLPAELPSIKGRTVLYRSEVYAEYKMVEEERARRYDTRSYATMRKRKNQLDVFAWDVHPPSATINATLHHWSEGVSRGAPSVDELRDPREDPQVHFIVLACTGTVVPTGVNSQERFELEVMLPTTTTYRVLGREQHSYRDPTHHPHPARHRNYIVLREE